VKYSVNEFSTHPLPPSSSFPGAPCHPPRLPLLSSKSSPTMTSFRTQRHFSQSSLALKHASGTALTFQPQQYLSPSRLISNRALGGIPQKFPDLATAKKVNIDFPYAAAQNFTSLLGPELRSKNAKFRFVYVSGKAADRGLEKQHRWFHDARHIKVLFSHVLERLRSASADEDM
jgi:hypothetical protein